MAAPVPTKIGKYDVVGVIGRGGMGVVYQATDPQLDRRVAIKMITGAFAENPDMLKRFFREAQSLGSLQHPNIVTVFDMGDYGGNPYFVMEYLEGEGLDSILSTNRQLSLLEKITIVIQVCHGLAYAHRRGVIHRDIKPANIMLSKDGGVKIFDFGIAHAGHQNVTRTGQVMGTLRYMAPEQFNSKSIDCRADIFSTGVVLYQLFTNHLPFEGENTATTMLKIVHDPPPPLSTYLATYPAEMEQILLRALAKNPDERYRSADELALDLAQMQGRLREELIGKEMNEVALLLDRGEVYKAQGSLLRVLKIDQQHTNANRLLREVQLRIQRDEISKQVRELRQHAEEALAEQQFDKALELADRALGLDRSDSAMQQLRAAIRDAAERTEKLHKALKIAEVAQAEGQLDAAKEAAEAALAVAPNDTQAKTLYRQISRDIEERARQRQMEGYLLDARQQISSRRYTAALEILKRAEELDPAAPQVHSLIGSASAGKEQERRRKELEALTQEVEAALNRDDYRTACTKADEGLARFPEDRNLLKLKAMADRQRLIEERKQFVEELLAVARTLLQAGRNVELKDKLEKAISQLGAEPRLQSLLVVVGENLQRERMEGRKAEALQEAKQLLDQQAFDDAIQSLAGLVSELGQDEDVQDLLALARSEQAEAVQNDLKRAEQEAVLDLRLKLLEEALRKSSQDVRVKEQLHHVRNLVDVISKVAGAALKLEESREYDRALAKWETVGTVYPQYPDLKLIIARVKGLRDQAQTDARQDWIDGIEQILKVGDFNQALTLLAEANQEYPWDSELMELQQQAETGARQRVKALKLLAEGRASFANQQWEAGAQSIMRAYQAASQDSVIRDQAVSELTKASRATVDKHWQASELILRRLAEIQPGAVPDVQATIQDRKREELIAGSVDAAKRKQARGDMQGALSELGHARATYPEDRRLQDLQTQFEQQIVQAREAAQFEEARRKKEAFVQDALDRARQTFVLDQRVQILEEALQRETKEVRLQEQLSAARDLRNKVATLESDARVLERSSLWGQALAKWEALAGTYRDYPGLQNILEQARQRHQRARLEAKANSVKGLQLAFSCGEYQRAEEQLVQAKRDFPGDRELAEIEKRVREAIANRAQAEKLLAGAAKAVDKEKWKKALEFFQDANAAARSDKVVREQVVKGLLSAADAALPSDSESSEMLMSEAARMEPNSPMVEPVRSRIEERKRGQFTEQCLSAALRCLSAGDWQGALRTLDRGLDAYPNEPKLLERKQRVEGEIRRREEEIRAKEAREKEAREKEVRDKAQREEEQRRLREEEIRQKEAKNRDAHERELREKEQRERELRNKAQREEEQRRIREEELRQKEAKNKEAREKVQREKQQREKELRDKELREKEQREKELREKDRREREQREEQQRAAQARAAERLGPKPAPPGPDDVSATRVFVQGSMPARPEASAQTASPVATPSVMPDRPPVAPRSHFEDETGQLPSGPAKIPGSMTGRTRKAPRFDNAEMPTAAVNKIAPPQPGVGSDALHEGSLQIIERQLAVFIGPLAKVLVKRAAVKTTSVAELYTLLAANIEREDDRQRFLAKRSDIDHAQASVPSAASEQTHSAPVAMSLGASSPGEITPAAIEQAARKLAAYVGPIAAVLAKKEAKRASSLRNFYEILAERVDPVDRDRFLKDAGIR